MNNKQGDEFRSYCRTKFDSINKRCKYRDSYKENGIKNNFTFQEFVEYADKKGLEQDFHCHRPDRRGNYEQGNLIFLSADEHQKISAEEKRAITPEQAREIRENKDKLSLRKLGELYGVSHSTIYKVIQQKGVYGTDGYKE